MITFRSGWLIHYGKDWARATRHGVSMNISNVSDPLKSIGFMIDSKQPLFPLYVDIRQEEKEALDYAANCPHDETDHGICLDCSMQTDMNAHDYRKLANGKSEKLVPEPEYMTKARFKKLWESNAEGGGITYDDIAECAVNWGLYTCPRVHPISEVTKAVLNAAAIKE